MNPDFQIGESLRASVKTRISQNKRAEGDEGNKKFTFAISTGSEDRHETIIDPNGGDFRAYMNNPVVLFNHDYNHVLGKALSVDVRGGVVIAQMEFDELDPFAADKKSKVERGFLNATSIGFIVKKWSYNEETEKYTINEWELTEFSIVSVPSNREALAIERVLGYDEERMEQLRRDFRKEISGLKNMVKSLVDSQAKPAEEDQQNENEDARAADEGEDNAGNDDILEIEDSEDPQDSGTNDSPVDDAIPHDDQTDSGDDQSSLEENTEVQPRAATAEDYAVIVARMIPAIRREVRQGLGKE